MVVLFSHELVEDLEYVVNLIQMMAAMFTKIQILIFGIRRTCAIFSGFQRKATRDSFKSLYHRLERIQNTIFAAFTGPLIDCF